MLPVSLSTLDFSGYFVGYSIAFAIVVLYYLLLSNIVRAFLLVQFVRLLDRLFQWKVSLEQDIDIGSIAFAFLSGTVFLNSLTFRTTNISVRVLQATIRFNWFYVDVREGDRRMDERLPCRLSLELVGVEVVVHHNSATYDHLASLVLNHPQVKEAAAAAGIHATTESEHERISREQQQRRQQQQQQHDASPGFFGRVAAFLSRMRPHRTSASLPSDDDDGRSSARRHAEVLLLARKTREQSMPAFYRWFPVTKVSVKTVAVMVGNLKLPHFLVVHFVSATAIHAINPPSSPHCYYQLTSIIQRLHAVTAYLQPNPEYTQAPDIVAIKDTLDAEDYFAVAIGAFGRFLSELDSELAQMQEKGGDNVGETRFIRSYRKGQARARSVGPLSQWSYLVQNDKSNKREEAKAAAERKAGVEEEEAGQRGQPSRAAAGVAAEGGVGERERQAEAEEKRAAVKEVVFECAEMSVEYVYDITTLLTSTDVDELREHPGKAQSEAPLTRMKVALSTTSMRYGPSIDNQRVLFMSYFKPFDYQNQAIYVPRVGQFRAYAAFEMEVVVEGSEGRIRVPYREAEKMREAEVASNRTTGWIDISFQADSSMSYIMNLLPTAAGTTTDMQLTLNQAVVTPSFTRQPFIEVEQLIVKGDLQYPQEWNALSDWKYSLTFHSPRISFLAAHQAMVSDLLSDWSSFTEYQQSHRSIGGAGLVYFQPSVMRYAVTMLDYDFQCSVNACNVIDRINDADANASISIRGPDCQINMRSETRDWKQRASILHYDLHLRNIHAHLLLPAQHPLSDLLESSNELQMLYATTLGVTGVMLTHNTYNAEYRDTHTMWMTMEGLEMDVQGHYLRYLQHLFDNYIGLYTHHLTTGNFILAGYRNILSHAHALKQWDGSVRHNAYESMVTVSMENLTFNLADHLFTSSTSHQPKLRCYEMQMQLRSLQQYTDVFLSFTPVTLTVPIPVALAVRMDEGVESGWNEKETSVQIIGMNLSYHSSKGDPPRSIVYRSSLRLMVDEVNAQLLPSQLALLVQSLTAISQQWVDAVDHSKPAPSTSTLVPTIDYNNDTLELITAKKQLISYLQDQLNTALADNSIELAVGAVRANLLHPSPPVQKGGRGESRLSVTRLLLSQGAQWSSSTLITPQAHSKQAIEVPTIDVSHLIHNAPDQHSSSSSFPFSTSSIPLQPHLRAGSALSSSPPSPATSQPWLSVADFHCGVTVSVSDQRVDCVSVMRKQQDFIYSQMHQEAVNDDHVAFSWHETNATRVPYTYNDDWTLSTGGGGAFNSAHAGDTYEMSPRPREREEQQATEAEELKEEVRTPVSASSIYATSPQPLSAPTLGARGVTWMRGTSAPEPASAQPILPPSHITDRLRSHAQKRSVQIARSGLMLPRATGPLSSRPASAPYRTKGVPVLSGTPTAAFHRRRPSLLQSVTAPGMGAAGGSGKGRSARPARLSEGSEEEEGEREEKEEWMRQPAREVPERVRLQRSESEGEEVSRSSFESCQSLSDVRPELSERLSEEGEQEETWEDCREEGQPWDDGGQDERAEGEWDPRAYPSQPSPHPSQATPADDGPLLPPLPFPSAHVPMVPSVELQQYLEHFSLHAHSHSFILPLHLQQAHSSHLSSSHASDAFTTFASSATTLSPSSSPHSSISLDSDLAGTAAGAFLVLPIVTFHPRAYPDHASRSPSPFSPPFNPPHHAPRSHFDDAAFPTHLNRPRPTSLDQMHRDHPSHSVPPPRQPTFGIDSLWRDDLDEQENATFTSTRHVVVEAMEDVSVTVTPAFVAALDCFLPLLQPTHSTIEDTLDELHLQFSKAFTSNEDDALAMALAREKPFTTSSHLAIALPSVSIELLQSAALPDVAAAVGGASSSLVYSTIFCVDQLSLQRTMEHPLPEGFGSATTSSAFPSLVDLASPVTVDQPVLPSQPPSSELTLSFSRLHVFSSLLNPSQHLAREPFSATFTPLSAAASALRSPIAIPPSSLTSLPPDLLSTCLVFVSFEVGHTSLHHTQAVDIVLHPPTPILESAPQLAHRVSSHFTFEPPPPAPTSDPMPSRRLSSSMPITPLPSTDYHEPITVVHRDEFVAKRGAPGFVDLSSSPFDRGSDAPYPYTATSATVGAGGSRLGGKGGWSQSLSSLFTPSRGGGGEEVELARLEGGGERRLRRWQLRVVDESETDVRAGEEKDDESKDSQREEASVSRAVDSEVRDRFFLPVDRRPRSHDGTVAPSAAPSPPRLAQHSPMGMQSPATAQSLGSPAFQEEAAAASTPLQYHHHRRVRVELTISSVHLSAGSDAPQRLANLMLEWYQATQQVDIVHAFDDQSRIDRDEALHPLHADEGGRSHANLLPLIPGGPGSSARRYRWQSVLSFALQHLQHSRVLEGGRSAATAFTVEDQVHLLEWFHYRAMRSSHEVRNTGRLHILSDADKLALQQDEQLLLDTLRSYGVKEEAFLPLSLQRDRRVYASQLPPSALAPQLHAILHQSTITLRDINYVLSLATPLTIAMRKLLKLPVSLMRRLNFKLQRMDVQPLASAASSSTAVPNMPPPLFSATSTLPHIDPQLDLHLDYTKLFSPDKLQTSPLTLHSLTTFARLAPQAAKVQSVYGPADLSPALWRIAGENIDVDGMGSKLDTNHQVGLDEEEHEGDVRIKRVEVKVINGEEDSAVGMGDTSEEGEVVRKDHAITLSSWTLRLHTAVTPRTLTPVEADLKSTTLSIPLTASNAPSNLSTPLPTPLATSARPSYTNNRPSLILSSLDGSERPLRPAFLHPQSLSFPLSPAPPDVPTPATVIAAALPSLVRVKEVIVLTDCNALWVEFSPSLHLFLESVLLQAEDMEGWGGAARVESTAAPADRSGADTLGDVMSPASADKLGGERSGGAGGYRQRSMSDPPVPGVSPRPPASLIAPSSGNRRNPLLLPPLITNLHVQCSLGTFGFRVRMPATGSIVLSTQVLALSVSRYIPLLIQESSKEPRDSRRPQPKPKLKRPRTNAAGGGGVGGADHKTGSLRKDKGEKEEKKTAAAVEREEKEGEAVAVLSDLPVTSVLVKVEGLDTRLLDAESCELPLSSLVGDDVKGARRGKESVLTSLVAQRCTLSASYTEEQSPLSQSSSFPSAPQSTRPSLIPTRSMPPPTRPTRPSLFNSRTLPFSPRHPPQASLAVIINCEESVLTLPFYELELLYFSDYLGPWRPTISMLTSAKGGAVATDAAASPRLPTRVTFQLMSVSLAMLPLPTVMITYHIDRLWAKVNRSRDDDLVFMLSIGAHNRATDQTDTKEEKNGGDPSPSPPHEPSPSSASFRPGDTSVLPVNSHKITLHSANARKRKRRGGGDDHGDEGGMTGFHTRRPTAFPGGAASMAALGSLSSSAYGGLGAVLYSKMQFVLDFALPTLRASMTVKKDGEQGGWKVEDAVEKKVDAKSDPQLDPAVAAALMRLSSEQAREEQANDSDGSEEYSSDEEDGRERGAKEEDLAFTTADAARIRLVEGIIGVGGMSNELNENVLNRLLHLQSTLNAEVNQLIDKISHYSQTMHAAAADEAGEGKKGQSLPSVPPLPSEDGVWGRYCLNVSVVFDDIHVTAGLDANKKTHRNRRNNSHPFTSGAFASTASDAMLSPSAHSTYFDSAWQPMVEVKTGTVSLRVQYTPRLYRLYKQRRLEQQRRHGHQRRLSRQFGDGDWSEALRDDVDPTFSSSDVVLEFNCYGAGIEISTSGRERYDAYTILMSQTPRRSLVQLASHIQLKLGLDSEGEQIMVELTLRESLMKVTAIPPLIGSVHALTDRYTAAYQHYQAEAAKLKAEEDFQDPLQGLRQLRATAAGWGPPKKASEEFLSPFPVSPPASDASAFASKPHLIADSNAGTLARVISLLDTLQDRTNHHLRLVMDHSEIVILFERPSHDPPPAQPVPTPAPARRPQRAPHSWSEIPDGPTRSQTQLQSVPPSPSLGGVGGLGSAAGTPLHRPSEGGTAFFSPWILDGPTSTATGVPITPIMSAIVLSLVHFKLQTSYLPAGAATASSSASSFASGYSGYRSVYTRQPINALHADVTGEGLELGFLTGLPETNNLQHLATTLLQFREAVTPQPTSVPSSSAASPTVKGVDDRSRRGPVYLYNRLLVRSSSLTMQSSLPVISAAAVLARGSSGGSASSSSRGPSRPSRGVSSSGHHRNASINSVASASSYLSSASTSTISSVVTRDITIQVNASSSGCEIDVDPSLVHHFHDTSALLDLLSSVSQEALDEHWTAPSVSPPPSRPTTSGATRVHPTSLSPLDGRQGDRAGGRVRSLSPRAKRGTRSTKRQPRSAESKRRRARRPVERESEEDSVDHLSDGPEGREARRRYRAKRAETTTRSHRRGRSNADGFSSDSSSSSSSSSDSREFVSPPSSPPPDRVSSPDLSKPSLFDVVTKTDIIVEVELNLAQGRLALHPTPSHTARKRVVKPPHHRHVSVDSGMHEWASLNRRVRGGTVAVDTQGDGPEELISPVREGVGGLYGLVVLPSVVCTYLAEHEQRTEHVLMVDVTQPPVHFSPSILQFLEQVDIETKKASSVRAHASKSPSAAAENAQLHHHERFVPSAPLLPRSSAATASSSSGLYSFLSDCAASRRAFTITLRIRPTSVTLNCSPTDDAVYLKLGTNRPFDVAICSSTSQLQSPVTRSGDSPTAVALPSIAVTAHLASMYLEIGAVQEVNSSLFLSLRVHHARLHFTQAYGLQAADESLPSRAIVFTVDYVQQSKLTVSACSSLLIWIRAWSLDHFAAEPAPDASHTSASTPTVESIITPAPAEPTPMMYILLSVGRVKLEVSMLDIEDVNSRAILSISQLACRLVNLGGYPSAPKPFLLSAEVQDFSIESHPDLDGLEGTLLCKKGVKLRLLRLPLAVAALEEDEGEEADDERFTDMHEGAGRRRRRRRSMVDDDSDYSDGPTPSHSRRHVHHDDQHRLSLTSSAALPHKLMVNKLECFIQPIHVRFTVLGGRVELIRGYSSPISISIQDQFYPTAPLDLFEERRGSRRGARKQQLSQWSGRWVTQSDIDLGERLVIGASSHAIPYFIDLITLVIRFLQAEISKHPVQPPPSLPPTRPNTAEHGGVGHRSPLPSSSFSPHSAGVDAMIDDGSGALRLAGRSIRVELWSEEERDRAVLSLVEYSLSLTKECDTKPIDDESELYQHLSPAAILRGEQEILRVLLLDVGKHRLDEEAGKYEYVPIRMQRPYSEGLFISRLSPPTDDREVVRVPGFVLEMETLEYEYQPIIRSRFLTFWDKPLTVTVDVRHYKFLQAIATAFITRYNTAVATVHHEAREMRETAKRAAATQQQSTQQADGPASRKDRGDGGGGIGAGTTSRVDHLQLPAATFGGTLPATPSSSSSRVKFHATAGKAATSADERQRVRSSSAMPATSSSSSSSASQRTGLQSLFQRRPDSPIQLYVKDEENKAQPPPTVPPRPAAAAVSSTAVIDSQPVVLEEKKEHADVPPPSALEPATSETPSSPLPSSDGSGDESSPSSAGGAGGVGGAGDVGAKEVDAGGVVEFNPQIHVLDNSGAGVSSRRVLELLGMKGDLSIIPQSTHQLTMAMDGLMHALTQLSRTIDTALD